MKRDKCNPEDAAELRRKAEEKLKAASMKDHQPATEMDALRMVHELQVHQIELEMQNEELKNLNAAVEKGQDLYYDLYNLAPVGYFTLDRQGNIRLVNLAGATLIGIERSRLVNKNFGLFVSQESSRIFNAFLKDMFETHPKVKCELVLQIENSAPIYVQLEAAVSNDGDECRIAVIDITEHKREEKMLIISKQELEIALKSAHMGVWQYDIVEKRRTFDDRVCALLGIDPTVYSGTADEFYAIMHPDDREKHKTTLGINISSGLQYEAEYRCVWADGTIHYISSRGETDEKNDMKIYGVIWDITARKREEENLRRFATVVCDSNDAITIQDFEGNITAWNRGAELMYGYNEVEALLMNIDLLTTPAKVSEQQDFIRRLIAGEAVTSFETQRVTKDGHVLDVWMTVTKLTGEDGTPLGLASTERDITARKREEAIITVQRDLAITLNSVTSLDMGLDCFLEAIFAASGMDAGGIYLRDSSGALVLQCHRGLGPDFIDAVSHFNATSDQARLVAAGKPIHTSHRALGLELTEHELAENLRAMSLVPILQGEKIIGCMNAASHQLDTIPETDQAAMEAIVTQMGNTIGRLRAEENLRMLTMDLERRVRERTVEAEAANQAKSIFIANMSHEIRTPLNAILGFAQLLERDPALTPRQTEYVHTINRSGENLLSLINDILDFAKIETGRATLNNAAFDLHVLLDDLELMFHSRAVAKGLYLLLERDDRVPRYVTGDEGKLRQILINLLGNAVKFTETGGVAVRVRVETPRGTTAEDKELLRLVAEVEDTGPGIADEDMVSIFNSFQQAKTGKSTDGTGLGLSISRDLVKMMSGELTVKSQVGVGSCFRFELPLELAADAVELEQPVAPRVVGLASNAEPVRILVVDDVADNRRLLCDLLQSVGFEVTEASNGVEALAFVDTWSPHAVLMDMRMPVMDGYEATRRLKASESSRAIPVIAVTASAFHDSRKLVISAGVDAYLRKPYRAEELFATLGKCLDLRYLYDEKTNTTAPPLSETRAALPAELAQSIRSAAGDGDIGRLTELIVQVTPLDDVAGCELQVMVDRYDYELIDEWLNKGDADHG
ncbi:MAG: PAS domain S-box protein [Armatimonadota bacterium]